MSPSDLRAAAARIRARMEARREAEAQLDAALSLLDEALRQRDEALAAVEKDRDSLEDAYSKGHRAARMSIDKALGGMDRGSLADIEHGIRDLQRRATMGHTFIPGTGMLGPHHCGALVQTPEGERFCGVPREGHDPRECPADPRPTAPTQHAHEAVERLARERDEACARAAQLLSERDTCLRTAKASEDDAQRARRESHAREDGLRAELEQRDATIRQMHEDSLAAVKKTAEERDAARAESARLAATLCGVREVLAASCPHCLGKLPHPPGPPCPPPRPGSPLWDAVAFRSVLSGLLKPSDGGAA